MMVERGNMKKKETYLCPCIKVVSFIVEVGYRISASIGDAYLGESHESTERITTFHQEGEWF